MTKPIHTLYLLPAVLAVSALASIAGAQVIQQTYSAAFPGVISGALPSQSFALEESFTLGSDSDFQAYTTSYMTGGFEATLRLYDASGGLLLSSLAPGTSPLGSASDLDAYLSDSDLAAGTYTLALTDYQLVPVGASLSDGFADSGNGAFIDQNGNTRTADFTLDLDATPPVSPVPEPATIWLLLPVALAAAFAGKRLGLAR